MSGFREKSVFNVQNEGHAKTPDSENFVVRDRVRSQITYNDYYRSTKRSYPPAKGGDSCVNDNGSSQNQKDEINDAMHLKRVSYGLRYLETDYSVEQHEMRSLPTNPFEDGPRGRRDSDSGENPFVSLLEMDLESTVYDSYPMSMTINGSEEDHFKMQEDHKMLLRRQECNRQELEARLPRFHYTKLPWFTIIVTLIQIIVFAVELIRMSIYTGSAFQTKPYFNPMLGPSTYLLISMGARYVPCMHRIENITLDILIQYPCPNSTSVDTFVCNLAELCLLGGFPIVDNQFAPDQWYRVITPIFLHAGFLHIIFNLLLQVSMGWSVEKNIGWIKYSIIYLASGVSGFLLGANFSPNGVASTGASGALFGVIATNLLLFIYCGKENTNIYNTKHYKLFIIIMVLEIVILFVLGLLPGLDNFSHIGGFCMGLILSVVLLKDPSFVYNEGIYVYNPEATPMELFFGNWNPMNNWDDKIRWKVLAWGGLRVACLTLAILYFALLFVNLYSKRMESETPICSWCKYLSCLPVNGWCDEGQVTVETVNSDGTTTSSSSTSSTTPTSSSAEATYTLPSSIENPNSKRDLHFGTFSASSPDMPSLGSPNYPQQHTEASIVLLAVMAALGYRYARRLFK